MHLRSGGGANSDDRLSGELLRRIAEDLLRASPGTVEPGELLDALFQVFGGYERVAQLLYEEWTALPPGHSSRIKILSMLVEMKLKFCGGESEDGGDLEQKYEELEALLKAKAALEREDDDG